MYSIAVANCDNRVSQLDEDEKNALVKIINSMLTKKRMKDLLDGKVKL